MTFELISEHASFGGVQRFHRHDSAEIGLPMRFALFLPRGDAVSALPGATASWDFGVAAGFYLDATQAPWATHWRMESYLMRELIPQVQASLGLDPSKTGIAGHSMGGHGALTLALRHPGAFASVSAIAPIAAPSRCPWGVKAFTGYLGEDRDAWPAHDASALIQAQKRAPYPHGILVDQGLADKFLVEQLYPEALESACASIGQPLTLRRHEGYDHGYFFIATVIDDHLVHHARQLIG